MAPGVTAVRREMAPGVTAVRREIAPGVNAVLTVLYIIRFLSQWCIVSPYI